MQRRGQTRARVAAEVERYYHRKSSRSLLVLHCKVWDGLWVDLADAAIECLFTDMFVRTLHVTSGHTAGVQVTEGSK